MLRDRNRRRTSIIVNIETARRAMLILSRAGHDWTARINALPMGDLLAGNAVIVVLCRLAAASSLRPIELMDTVHMTSGGLTKLLDRLEDAGFVTRLETPPSEDRRGVEVALTVAGRNALDQVLETVAPSIGRLVEELSSIADGHLARED
jgi:DNA-binding MarR family transcriptional regulator